MTSINNSSKRAALAAPPIPTEFREELRELDDWLFGTEQALEISLYDQESFTARATDPEVKPALFIGHQGHGTNSWALHYYLFQPDLSLLLQMPLGGAYQDEEKCFEKIETTFATLSELFVELAEAKSAGRWPAARLFVLESHVNHSRKVWIPRSKSPDDEPAEKLLFDVDNRSLNETPLQDALDDIRSLKANC